MNNLNTAEETLNIEAFLKYNIERKINGTRYVVYIYNTNKKGWRAVMPIHAFGFSTVDKREEWITNFKTSKLNWEQEKIERRTNRKSNPDPITKTVKEALVKKYGFKQVKVNRGRGTARGWVEAYVRLPKPECENHEVALQENFRCDCRELENKAYEEAQKAVYFAMKEAGQRFYTYCSDDGYGTDRDEFLLSVRYNN